LDAAMLIRPSRAADAADIASLLNALLATTTIEWTVTPRTEDDVQEWLRAHEVVLVAEDLGDVLGVAAFGWFRDVDKWPGYRFTVENTIHVREDRWGSGLGELLMRALIDQARASGLHTMIAAIDSANEPSIRFHERLGFTEVARLPEVGAKFGHWLDLVLLQITLDERAAPSDD
jgi:L-amino acid N-acyltransferase YncA